MSILGYSVIEELVTIARWKEDSSLEPSLLQSFKAGFVDSDKSQLEASINLIKAPYIDCLCTLRTSKEITIIPQGQSKRVSCRANTAGLMTSNTPVLFEPDELSPRSAGLGIYETLKTVKKGSVSGIEIEVHNTSQHDIILPGRTQL